MNSAEANRLVRPQIAAVVAFLLAALVAAGIIWRTENARLETDRARVTILATHGHEIQRSIEHALSAAYALAALVRREKGTIDNFEAIASQLLPFYPGVAALQLAPGGIIRQSIPLAGNEKAIGHNLLQDPLRTKEAFLARDTGKLTLAGPFNLIQGGQAAVGRLPVFLNDDRGQPFFWGFISVVIRFPDVLNSASLPQLAAQGFDYELWRIHPDSNKRQVIAASSTIPLTDPVEVLLRVPNATWTLSVAPAKGWRDPAGLLVKAALGLFFSLILAFLAMVLAKLKQQQLGLQDQVEGRTREILATKNQLKSTLEAIPDILFELDLEGCCHDCHAPNAIIWSNSTKNLIGKSVAETLPLEATDVIMAALREADEFGHSHGMQFQLQLPQGQQWFELSVSRKAADLDASPHFIVLSREITQRKRVEEALKTSEQRFRDMVNTTDGIVWEADATTFTFTFIGKQAERLLGYPVEDWLKPGFWVEHLHPDDKNWAPEYCAACTGRLEPHDFEYRAIAKDGRVVWLRDIVTVVPENGRPRWLRGIMVDVTKNKWAEMALRENSERFNAITQSAIDAIVTANSEGNIVGWNPRAEVVFGYTAAEVNLQPITLLMPERFRERHVAGINRLRSGGETRVLGNAVELEGLRKDGSEFPMELSLAKWEVAGQYFFSGTIRDITNRKRNEANLRVAAIAFESQEGMMVTDADARILRVNRAFSEITGYSAEEAAGQKPKLLNSGRHGQEFYAAMWSDILSNGTWQGEIWNRRKNGEVYLQWLTINAVKSATGVVANYVGTMTDITRHKQAEDAIQHLAFYDALTQLPNRRLLADRLEQALASCTRSGREGALLFIDLDDFKTLNETLGHDIGDLLLREVAKRLPSCVREGDTVARFGGDEFVIMLEDLSESPQEAAIQAETVGEKIIASLNQHYRLAGAEHHSTPSIGVTLFGNQRDTVEELLKRADLAMYQAKAAGRNTLRFFDPHMQTVVTARAALEADLRLGLRNGEFLLYYQPQVDREGHLKGVEALVRWLQPQRGLVSPAEFVPLAESTGLILALGHWVLETACLQLVAWAANPEMANITMAVNVSARQFRHKDFVDQVVATLEHTGANSKRLKLELTESLLVDDIEDTIDKMTLLKAKGVSFSLDDFGTGYSSLSYLKRLPLDQLKIDQSFVRDILTDPNDAAIARTVIALGQSLGLEVIAEGVETGEQRNFLADHGCRNFQGYLFGRPGPANESEQFHNRVIETTACRDSSHSPHAPFPHQVKELR